MGKTINTRFMEETELIYTARKKPQLQYHIEVVKKSPCKFTEAFNVFNVWFKRILEVSSNP